MKRFLKRALAVSLAVVMLVGSAPLSGFVGLDLPNLFDFKAEALSTDDYLDYSVFEMEYLMSQLEHDGTILNGSVDIYSKVINDDMFHRDVYEVYSADVNLQGATFAAVQLWDNDINLIAHPEHFYSVILMDLLQNNELLDYSVDSLKSNVVSNTNKVVEEAYEASADSLIESLGIENLKEYMNSDFNRLSDTERVILGDQLIDCNRFSMEYADVMDALALLDVVADVGTTISNAISRANSLYAIAGFNKNNITLLLDMYHRSGNSDLKTAILDIVGIYSELDSAEEIYTALNGNITSYAVDSLLFTTTKLVASTLFKSALGLATFVWDIGSAVTNMLFDVSDVATCYMVIEASTLIEDELRSLMSSYRSSYLSSKTSANAEKCKTVYNLTLANQYYALSAVKKLAYSSFGNGSLWGMVKSAFGCQDYQTVADICDSQMSIVEGRYYKWVSLAQKMYKNVYGVSFSHATAAPTVSVSSVSFERSSYTLFMNEGILNRATAYPTNAVDREVYYSSSDPSVAVVGAYGNITAVSYGEAVITATTLNGKSASCKITVLPYDATVVDGSYTIDKFYDGVTDVIIPSSVNGISITKIGDYAFKDASVTSVEILDNIKKIGEYAFYGCSVLTSVKLPNSITELNDYTFYYCESLKHIKVPDSVIAIGNSVFGYCRALESVEISNSVTAIGNLAFYYCDSLANLTIPDSVTTIGKDVLDCCYGLENVIIGNGVTAIENEMFRNFDKLIKIIIGNNVTTIGEYAFESCDSLTSVMFGNKVVAIGKGAFQSCDSLEVITVPNGVTIIDDYTFAACGNLKTVNLPNSVTKIGSNVFSRCRNLVNVIIPYGVVSIGENAFSGCQSIESIIIPNGVTSIAERTFQQCKNLREIHIPIGVTKIGDYAFWNLNFLTDVSYAGSEQQWNNISVGNNNSSLLNARIHFYQEHDYHECVKQYIGFVNPSTTKDGYKCYQCTCGMRYEELIPGTRLTAMNGVEIIFDDSLICSVGVGETSLDDYLDFEINSYEWQYETLNGTLGTGSKAIITDGADIIGEYTVVIFGDIDGNGWYDANDAFLVKMLVSGLLTREVVGEAVYKAADCNHDGAVDELDVQLLERASVLLDNVNQSATQAELESNSFYIEYCSVIDQSAGIEADSEPEKDTVQPPVETQPESDVRFDIEAIFRFIFSIFEKMFTVIISLIG